MYKTQQVDAFGDQIQADDRTARQAAHGDKKGPPKAELVASAVRDGPIIKDVEGRVRSASWLILPDSHAKGDRLLGLAILWKGERQGL